MKIALVAEVGSLVWRVAVQDGTAERAAVAAHDAEKTVSADSESIVTMLVRHCRVHDLKLHRP